MDFLDHVELARDPAEIDLGCQADVVAALEPLQLRIDAVDVVDLRPEQVFDPLVGVEAAAALAHLDEPRPDVRRRGSNCDRPCGLQIGGRNELITGQRLGCFLRCCAPAAVPSTRQSRQSEVGESRTADLQSALHRARAYRGCG